MCIRDRNKAYYESRYGADSPQARDCSDGYRFEPAVAQRTFERMLAEAGPGKITVLTGRQFDAEARYVVKKGDRIVSIRVLDRTTGREEHYSGAMFIDATYEGEDVYKRQHETLVVLNDRGDRILRQSVVDVQPVEMDRLRTARKNAAEKRKDKRIEFSHTMFRLVKQI